MTLKNLGKKFMLFWAALLVSFSVLSVITPMLPATQSGAVVYAQEPPAEEEAPSCEEDSGGGEMSWWLCPALRMLDGTVDWLDRQINGLLEVPDSYFQDPNQSLYKIWGKMRNIAYIVLVPITLVMVISTALGFDFISAYTIKRALPRLIAAVIFIALSYALCRFAIQLTNAIGQSIVGLLTTTVGGPDQSLDSLFNPGNIEGFTWTAGLLFGGGAAALGALATGSIGVVMSLAFVAMLGLGLGLLALAGRQLILVALVLISPVAILAWIFPGNDKLWKLWWGTFSKLLILYPLIMLLLGAGRALAFVIPEATNGTLETILKLVAYIGPFFFIPTMFKFAGSLFATLTNVGRDKARGLFDSQRKYRADRKAQTAQDTLEMKSRRGQNALIGGMYRRRKMGGFGLTSQSQANYQGRVQSMMAGVQAKALEQDHGRAAGDDDANTLLQEAGMTGNKFLSRYAAMAREGDPTLSEADAMTRARTALATAESSYGAKVGTQAMQRAAYAAKMTSTTGYSPTGSEEERTAFIGEHVQRAMQANPALTTEEATEEAEHAADKHFTDRMYQQIEADSQAMIAQGYMTAADTVATQKANAKRSDISGVSFGTTLNLRSKAANAYAKGARGEALLSAADVEKMQETVLDGGMAGAILGQRPESVKAMVPVLRRRLQTAATELEAANASGDNDVIEAASAKFADELATVSAWHQVAGQVSPQNRKPIADGLMTVKVAGMGGATAQDLIDATRGDARVARPTGLSDAVVKRYISSHHEFSNALTQQAQQEQYRQQSAEQQAALLEQQRRMGQGQMPGQGTLPGMQ